MKLKAQYESSELVPEKFAELYEEKDGRMVLSGIEGVASAEALSAAERNLGAARRNESSMKAKLEAWEGLAEGGTLEEFTETIGGMREQIEASQGEDIDAKIASAKSALERQLRGEKTRRENAEAKLKAESIERNMDRIKNALLQAATGAGLRPEAVDDAMARVSVFESFEDGSIATAPNNGVEPGLSPTEWLEASKQSHPHWWPRSKGAGAEGGGGDGGGENKISAEEAGALSMDEFRKARQAGDIK